MRLGLPRAVHHCDAHDARTCDGDVTLARDVTCCGFTTRNDTTEMRTSFHVIQLVGWVKWAGLMSSCICRTFGKMQSPNARKLTLIYQPFKTILLDTLRRVWLEIWRALPKDYVLASLEVLLWHCFVGLRDSHSGSFLAQTHEKQQLPSSLHKRARFHKLLMSWINITSAKIRNRKKIAHSRLDIIFWN